MNREQEQGTSPARGEPAAFLTGRVALVTGGARRIGRALVLALAGQGARIIIHHLDSEAEARQTATMVSTAGGEVALVRGDLADPQVPAELIDSAVSPFGPVDILVNNASIFAQGGLADTSAAEWDRHQAINLRAPFLLSQAFASALPGDRKGDIINLNDYRVLRPGGDHLAYTISKVGLSGLTRSLARDLAPRIRVNELALGAVLPPEGESESYLHTLKQEIPLARFGRPEEVAATLLFLLGSRFVTGQTVCVDGGRHLV